MTGTDVNHTTLLYYLLSALGGFAAGAFIHGRLANLFRVRRLRRGIAAEADAGEILEEQGYTILRHQDAAAGTMFVDAAACQYTVRADFIAEKNGRTALVEVKTGELAPDPLYPPTRRQLLEYSRLFAVDEYLLLNMTDGTLHRICFPGGKPGGTTVPQLFRHFVFGLLCGAAVVGLLLLFSR